MAQTGNFTPILLYSSIVSGNTPGAANLNNSVNGAETAINIADGRLFYKDISGVVQKIADKNWSGDVIGPASATDNALARYDTTTGKLIQNSLVTLADSGTISLIQSTTSDVPLKMPYGVAPTSPVQGDVWSAYTGLYFKNSANNIEQLDIGSNAAGTLSNPTITVAGSGATINVTSVEAVLFSLPGWQGDYKQFVVPAATGLALTDQSANYLIVSYNAGSPVYSVTTNPALITNSDVIGATLLWREGTAVHFQTINWGLSTASRLNRRLVQTDRYQRASGLALGESTGNVITLTAGNIWYGVSEIIEGAVTSASSNSDFYFHIAGVWTKSTVSTYNITQYDNGTNLATLGGTNYAVNWVYRYLDGAGLPKLAYVLGGGNYNLAQAVASGVPTPPPILTTMAILVGRIIVKKSAATATQIDSAFASTFTSTSVTDHNDLAGLQGGTTNEYYHLSSAQYTVATQAATSSLNGYLSSTDWTTFNNKQPAGTYVTSVTGTAGRITSSGGTTPAIDLASGIATAGTTGSSTLIPVVTIDTYGRVTSITTASNPQGTVTSVTGTAPVVSSGGATPAISMAAATGSVNGYLTSTDWTTFNSKTSNTGTVTSVAATVPSFLSVSGSPITTSGTLAITLSGTALPVANGGTGQTSFTANQIHYGTFSQSSGLTFDGTNFATTGYATATSFRPSSSTVPTNGMYLPTTNQLGFATNSSLVATMFSSGGVSIGNTTDPGATNLSVTGSTLALKFYSGSGSIPSVGNGVATTLFASITSDSAYIVSAYIPNTSSPSNYTAIAIVKTSAGASAVTTLSPAIAMLITVSGLNVQATQTAGSSQTINYSYTRIY